MESFGKILVGQLRNTRQQLPYHVLVKQPMGVSVDATQRSQLTSSNDPTCHIYLCAKMQVLHQFSLH